MQRSLRAATGRADVGRDAFRRTAAALGCSFVVASLFAVEAAAQAPTTVQLPTFRQFGVHTTVSIPDRGTASLGGVRRSSNGYTAYGPSSGHRHRALGGNVSAGGISASAEIHDFQAHDRAFPGPSRAQLEVAPAASGGFNEPARGLSVREARRLFAMEQQARLSGASQRRTTSSSTARSASR